MPSVYIAKNFRGQTFEEWKKLLRAEKPDPNIWTDIPKIIREHWEAGIWPRATVQQYKKCELREVRIRRSHEKKAAEAKTSRKKRSGGR